MKVSKIFPNNKTNDTLKLRFHPSLFWSISMDIFLSSIFRLGVFEIGLLLKLKYQLMFFN